MIQENQDQELELEEEKPEEKEEEKIEEKPEKPPLTLEQKRGILKRQLTKVEKELGISEEKPKDNEEKKEATPQNASALSIKDIKALSDVHEDDIDWLTNWAKFNNLTISEAKKTTEAQTILRTRAENRASAEAANTGGGRRGAEKVSDESLLNKASKNELPDSDEGIKALAEARMNQKLKK